MASKLPPLFLTRPPGLQLFSVVVVPALFGVLCGVMLGVSGPIYTALTILLFPLTILAGLEHEEGGEGFTRGFMGGLVFGTFILLTHAVLDNAEKAALPAQHVSLPIATAIFGGIAAAIGAVLRRRLARREARAHSA